MSQFILLLKGNFQDWQELSDPEKKQIMEQYGAYVGDLNRKKILINGDSAGEEQFIIGPKLEADGPEIRKIASNSFENITGYFIIEAESMEHAITIAKDCPALTHNDCIQVIPLGEN